MLVVSDYVLCIPKHSMNENIEDKDGDIVNDLFTSILQLLDKSNCNCRHGHS